jgi:predicted nucleic acid-binding protein
MPYLLDSDVLIDISRGKQESIDYVDTLVDPWMISQVTAMELQVGARDKREAAFLDAFLSSYPIVPLSHRNQGVWVASALRQIKWAACF